MLWDHLGHRHGNLREHGMVLELPYFQWWEVVGLDKMRLERLECPIQALELPWDITEK